MLYEALSGSHPIGGQTFGDIYATVSEGTFVPLASRAPSLPREVSALVASMLQRDREKRPGDLDSLQEALRKV